MNRIIFIVLSVFLVFSGASADDDPLSKLKDDTLLYFTPLKGVITRVEGKKVFMTIDTKYAVRPGMRLKALREGTPFFHPVTKELLGRVESTVGRVEIQGGQAGEYEGLIVEGSADKDDKVRISGTKVKMVFFQDKAIDWYLADEYYRKLKQTGRIEMIDTALETGDETELLKEARRLGADVALSLTAKPAEKGTLLRQRLYWVSDGSKFIDSEALVDAVFTKKLKFGEEYFAPQTGEALLKYDLPFGARFIATGDFDGDGKQEIALSSGQTVKVYAPEVDLRFLWEVNSPSSDEHIWIDTIDLNRNGRDELVITSIRSGQVLSDSDELIEKSESGKVMSYIYELDGSKFTKLWQNPSFLRSAGARLFAQAYSDADGFKGDIYTINWDGNFSKGDRIKVPHGVNIYDFVTIRGADNESLIFAYDENGYLNLFNEKGIRTWRSSSDTGGFITGFKKKSTVSYLDRGKWYVKDRLITDGREVLAVERVPLAKMARGIGVKSSRIRNYWWNGFSMESGVLINDIKGSVQDFALAGDRIAVLTSPFLGIKFDRILKGENPLGTLLYIYSVAGR